MSNPPATLPANFFETPAPAPQGAAGPPKTLPADFFEQPNQPAAQPDNSYKAAASQATGLSADTRGPIGRAWDEIKGGLTAAQPGEGLKPQPTALGNAAEFAGMVGSTATGLMGPEAAGSAVGGAAETVSKAIPSAERAGKTMNTLREAIGTHPVEMTDNLSKATSRAQELADNGNTMPTAMRKFIMRVTDPEKGHLTYNEARDFLTKFGSMTQEEATKIAPAMHRQIEQVAGNLRQAISETAERAGKLELFQQSNREYSAAKTLEKAKEILKNYGEKAAIGGTVGGVAGAAGYGIYKELKSLFE